MARRAQGKYIGITVMAPISSSRSTMLELIKSRQKCFSLPQRFYTDPELYELDLEAIFHRRWVFAGVECEIRNPGDYFTLTIGRTSILVLRDRAGEIRAFFNTCRHRGSKICLAEKGTTRAIVCPYHQWSYDLTGRLVATGRMQEDFDRRAYSLKPVNVRTSGGTIYICLSEDAPNFSDYGPLIEPYLEPHNLADAKLAHETHAVVKGNWKLMMENSRECFHCRARHPELMRSFLDDYNFADPAKDQLIAAFWEKCSALGLPSEDKLGDDFRVVRLPFARGAVSITMDGTTAVSRLLGRVPHNDIGSVRWVHYPSTYNHALADYAVLFRMLPIGPQETLLTTKWLVDRHAEAGRDYDLTTLVRVWAATNDQDKALVERNQEGINSVGYQPGPYSQHAELGVIRFAEWYCDTLEAYLEKRSQHAVVAA